MFYFQKWWIINSHNKIIHNFRQNVWSDYSNQVDMHNLLPIIIFRRLMIYFIKQSNMYYFIYHTKLNVSLYFVILELNEAHYAVLCCIKENNQQLFRTFDLLLQMTSINLSQWTSFWSCGSAMEYLWQRFLNGRQCFTTILGPFLRTVKMLAWSSIIIRKLSCMNTIMHWLITTLWFDYEKAARRWY